MSIEFGARMGIVAPDDATIQYVAGRPFAPTGPGQLMLQTFTDTYTLSDGNQTIELYNVEGLNHSDNMTIVYLPKAKIVINADMHGPPAAGGTLPFVSANNQCFKPGVEIAAWCVPRIVSVDTAGHRTIVSDTAEVVGGQLPKNCPIPTPGGLETRRRPSLRPDL